MVLRQTTPCRFSARPSVGGISRGGAEILYQSCAGGFAGALFEKVGRGFYDANFFGDGDRDPLVERDAVFFREALRSFLDRERELQWIRGFAHGFTLQQFLQIAGSVDDAKDQKFRPSNTVKHEVPGKSANRCPPHISKLGRPEVALGAGSRIFEHTQKR